mmetsp:Transcript_33152/g.28051  ORF Transcript_33152/g.28051 Transcript_33152/m.28051 type:complete len:133 (+) Transcript_33152:761-1159(+)
MNLLSIISHVKYFKREVKFDKSRFDVSGEDKDGNKFIMEIKCVPLNKPRDCTKIKLKEFGKTHTVQSKIDISNTAYFPEGYRKKAEEVVSERALKHVEEMDKFKSEGYRVILCFVVLRSDAVSFEINEYDPI